MYSIPIGIGVILYLLVHLLAWNRICGHVETAVCVMMYMTSASESAFGFFCSKHHLCYVSVELRWFYGLCWHFAFFRIHTQHTVSLGLLRVPNICRLSYYCSSWWSNSFYIYMFSFRDILSVGVLTWFCIWEQHSVLTKRRSSVGVTEKTITLVPVTSSGVN